MSVQFENIYHGDASDLGKLKFNAAGLGWKAYSAEDNSDNITYAVSDVRSAAWFRGSRLFTLRLQVRQGGNDRARVSFEGFKRDEHDKVKRTLDEFFGVKLETRDTSLKGWNWGQLDVHGNDMHFQVQNKTAFEIPLSIVSNSNIAGKNEVAVEFAPQPIPAPGASSANGTQANHTYREPDELVEMRFYVPGMSKKKGEDVDMDGDDDDDEVEVDGDGKEVTAAEAIHRAITEHADIKGESGDSLVIFEDILVLTPRGRFSLEFYMDSVRLLGKSTDYRVPFTSIHRIFAIPKIDDMHVQLILGLDPPIRQGATRYPFLVAQLPQDEHTDAELNVEDEDLAKFPELQRKYEDATYKVISFVLKAMTGKRIVGPGSFKSVTSGEKAYGVKANVKAVQGELYFLDKALIFIAKQPILVDYSKTELISFSRVGAGGLASSRTFDMRVSSRSGSADHVFSAIPKEEATAISTFLASKGVKLENEMDDALDMVDAGLGSDDDDDEDADILSSDDERQKGKKGKKGKESQKPRARDDDTESEDEDFQGGSSDGGSPSPDSDSDADSDDDGGAESDASDPMMEELKRKAAAKKAKKNKKDAEGESEEEKPKKKKPKTDD